MPNATRVSLEQLANNAGAGAALLRAIQMLGGAAASFLVGHFYDDTLPTPWLGDDRMWSPWAGDIRARARTTVLRMPSRALHDREKTQRAEQ